MHAAHDTIWQTIDQTLLGLAARAGDLDAEFGRWLIAAAREGVHRHFVFASLAAYVERRPGFDTRTTRKRLRDAPARQSSLKPLGWGRLELPAHGTAGSRVALRGDDRTTIKKQPKGTTL